MIDYGFGVRLGPLSDADSETLRLWRNNPKIYKWCRQYEPLEKWNHEKWLSSLASRSDVKMYGIFTLENELVGVCGLTDIDYINSRAEFSIYVGEKWWGRKLGEKGLRTLLSHGFRALNLHNIWGETYDGNPAFNVFKKVGFKKDGIRRSFYFRDGVYIDAHLFSILRSEFDAHFYDDYTVDPARCNSTNHSVSLPLYDTESIKQRPLPAHLIEHNPLGTS